MVANNCSDSEMFFISQISVYLSNKIIITPFTYPLPAGGYGKGVFLCPNAK